MFKRGEIGIAACILTNEKEHKRGKVTIRKIKTYCLYLCTV